SGVQVDLELTAGGVPARHRDELAARGHRHRGDLRAAGQPLELEELAAAGVVIHAADPRDPVALHVAPVIVEGADLLGPGVRVPAAVLAGGAVDPGGRVGRAGPAA